MEISDLEQDLETARPRHCVSVLGCSGLLQVDLILVLIFLFFEEKNMWAKLHGTYSKYTRVLFT